MENHHLLHLIFQADPVVQLVLFLLVAGSVVCWAIIVAKHRQLKKSENKNDLFLRVFWETPKLAEIPEKSLFRGSPAYNIYQGVKDILHHSHGHVELALRRSLGAEIEQLEYLVPFLATTASAAPFIGLFGTVWGILIAFWKIGQAGASSLSIVGPHIAEALIATAMGLGAAIPAVIFYNMFINRIRRINRDLENFVDDLLERAKRSS